HFLVHPWCRVRAPAWRAHPDHGRCHGHHDPALQARRGDFRGRRFAEHGRDVKGNNELLSLVRPELIAEIHEQYLQAGADIISTNTFGATAIAQSDYDLAGLAYEMNVASAKLARAAADAASTPQQPRFVAGALGPQPRTASISPDVNDPGARNVTFEELRDAYTEQLNGLLDGGIDIVLIETIF